MSTKLAKIIADFRTSLSTKISVAGEGATLLSATDDDSVALPTGKYYFTLDGDNNQKEHIYATLTGTTLSLIKSISRQGVESTGVAREHRIGATVTITDFAHILRLNELLDGTTDLDSTVPLKYDGDPTLTLDAELATVKYADDLAIAGSPNISLTVKGIGEEATAAEINAGTQTGGTSAELLVNPKYLKDSEYYTLRPTSDEKDALAGSGTPSSSNKFVTADTDALKEVLSNKDTDNTLAADSDTKYPSQKAVKAFVATQVATAFGTSKNGYAQLDWAINTTVETVAHGLGSTPAKLSFTIYGEGGSLSHAEWDASGQSSLSTVNPSGPGGVVDMVGSTSDCGTIHEVGSNRNIEITVTADATNITFTIATDPSWSARAYVVWSAIA